MVFFVQDLRIEHQTSHGKDEPATTTDRLGLHEDCEKIEGICLRAMREHSLLLFLHRLVDEWEGEVVELRVSDHVRDRDRNDPTAQIVANAEELQSHLDESTIKAQAVLSNKYIEPNRAQAEAFLSTLETAQESLDIWLHLQRVIGSLKPVFMLGDIGKSIPKQTKAFVHATEMWRGVLAGIDGKALSALGSPNTLDSLKSLAASLHEVECGLQEYLTTKR